MITVIIATQDEEEPLLRTLAALAPLATEGLIADVVVADCGSGDATLTVAEAAGCIIVENCADRASAIERAVKLARKTWLLSLAAGDRPDVAVATALRDHIAQTGLAPRPAAFLALPAGAGMLRRATLGAAFDAFGLAHAQSRRILARRNAAHFLASTDRRWRGVRLRARIVAPTLRP
jgi:glycosyltransferase involved in cell wall biosynthesis